MMSGGASLSRLSSTKFWMMTARATTERTMIDQPMGPEAMMRSPMLASACARAGVAPSTANGTRRAGAVRPRVLEKLMTGMRGMSVSGRGAAAPCLR